MKRVSAIIGKILNIAIRGALLVALVVICIPLGYFVWRANQPMAMPQFSARTYLEWMGKRQQAYDELAQRYQKSHPEQEVRDGICFYTELGVELVGGLPSSGFYALAGIYPGLQRYVDPRDLRKGVVPENVSWPEFLPAWWLTFEKFVWSMAEHAPQGPVPYCRISPTPENGRKHQLAMPFRYPTWMIRLPSFGRDSSNRNSIAERCQRFVCAS